MWNYYEGYKERQTDRQRQTDTEAETNRQTQRHTDTDIDRELWSESGRETEDALINFLHAVYLRPTGRHKFCTVTSQQRASIHSENNLAKIGLKKKKKKKKKSGLLLREY